MITWSQIKPVEDLRYVIMVYGFLYIDRTRGPHIIQKEHEPLLVGHLDMEALVQNYCSV